ncbi:MAG: hypothetical protein A2087_10280 [Spirochaetes bacterium GWD1_61_31]|nr:MAG: hypothetical protein A2Y37_12235 [Spirochaetes bacterium GWB1_60_80]OHD30141.1 MAG: hypothetical protein A2004_14100 [Spirochaetes bacterium GWC1_61_12]OHD34604.1 MAG: hypothetical protein A2087_10280 [Spirochaetes bacterium GWD1_61_31]OHD46420.1 MAG: hypothetical protein A2Y35_10185 [Spirochaetes bacterium GWE1_60_18]OHD59476.1 MAG: hypothetical protein A2Y32_10140 [Spirochaetes bacterium GWF1_60_12]HAW86092.1 hypothetical protein [Spirochaetaceae bacterium]
MILQTGEMQDFCGLMLLPPGNIQQAIVALCRGLQQQGILDLTGFVPPFILLAPYCPSIAADIVEAEARRLAWQLDPPTWMVLNEQLYLSWPVLPRRSTPEKVDQALASIRSGAAGRSQATIDGFGGWFLPDAPPHLFCGRLKRPAAGRPESVGAGQAAWSSLNLDQLRFRSGRLAMVAYHGRLLPSPVLSWRIRFGAYLKAGRQLPET